MATKKIVVTTVKVNNSPKDVPVVNQAVETEVIDGQVVIEGHITNAGVVYSNSK